MKLSIIIPTITGREDSLAAMVAAYRERTPGEFEILTPKDYPCWPAGCNAGRRHALGDVLHFGSDDLEPIEGWAEPMFACLAEGFIPAPQVWDHVHQGPPVNQDADGLPGSITTFTRVPALTHAMSKEIGDWPEIPYFADNWVSDKGRLCGYQTRMTEGYGFVHHWSQVGRLDEGNWWDRNLPLYNAERAKLGLGPI